MVARIATIWNGCSNHTAVKSFISVRRIKAWPPPGTRLCGPRAGPLVALLDPDDMWEPEYLEVQTGQLASHPEAGVACANVTFMGETTFTGQTFLDKFPDRGDINFHRLLSQQCRIFSSVTARRELILQAGLFDRNLRAAEDLHLWLRLAHMGTKFLRTDRPLVRYRARPESLSNDPARIGSDVVKVYKHLSQTLDLNAADRACLEEAIRREEANLDFYLAKKALYAGRNQEATGTAGPGQSRAAQPQGRLLPAGPADRARDWFTSWSAGATLPNTCSYIELPAEVSAGEYVRLKFEDRLASSTAASEDPCGLYQQKKLYPQRFPAARPRTYGPRRSSRGESGAPAASF